MKTILVFKTSVQNKANVYQLQPVLDQVLKQDESWNFDLEDCDKILRVESISISPLEIIEKVKTAGFSCLELTD